MRRLATWLGLALAIMACPPFPSIVDGVFGIVLVGKTRQTRTDADYVWVTVASARDQIWADSAAASQQIRCSTSAETLSRSSDLGAGCDDRRSASDRCRGTSYGRSRQKNRSPKL